MIGRLVSLRPGRVVVFAVLLFVPLLYVAAGAMGALSLNRYEAAGSESMAARAELAERFGTGSPNIALLVTPVQGDLEDPDVRSAGQTLTAALAAHPGVGDAWSFWDPQAPDTLASEDGKHALVLAWAPGNADRVRAELLPEIQRDVLAAADSEAIAVQLGGADEVFRVVAGQARADFIRAEVVVLPLVAVLLWVVYRRVLPALATLGVGIFAVAGSLALLRLVTLFTDVSTFAANIALVMGIGLGVDYGLLVTYRFREEQAVGHAVPEAVRRTVAHAGRTVIFSGITVAASLAVLLVFPFPFLSSFAYAGIAVVLSAMVGSLVLLPALLRLMGQRVVRKGVETPVRQSLWFRTTTGVMRRPVITGGAALVVLVLLGAPALGTTFGSPDDRILPAGQPVRSMYDTIRADFATEDADAIQVVVPTLEPESPMLVRYAAALSQLEGVHRVDTAVGAFTDGVRTGPAGPGGPERFMINGEVGTWLAVVPTGDRLADDPTGLVTDVRALPAPVEALVGGYPAELTDYRDGVIELLPLVGALIIVITFVVLFWMTGSVIAPIKAVILNLLSLSVMFGVLVWGFQEGALAGVLGFTPTGTIEPSIPILMFCIAYGLSMDYEVFLLARIKAEYDRTGDAVGSIPLGIARSAPLVTAAAVILAASFAVYVSGEVTFLQQMGVGMGVTVLVDATLIRGVLVPAAMRLAGRFNWWAPGPLRRLHQRFGVREESADLPAAPPEGDPVPP